RPVMSLRSSSERSAAEAVAFYKRHYTLTGFWLLAPGKPQAMVGDPHNRKCRFCNRRPPEATFRMEAHAIPQATGNRNLLTAHECDDCNQFFGQTIENEFGNWSKPMRTLARIRGQTGRVPSLKGRSGGGWRIDDTPDGLNITHGREDAVMEADHEARLLTFRVPRDAYRPVSVLKAFVKMGLSLMPEGDLPNFTDAIEWIVSPNHESPFLSGHSVMMEVLPGPAQSAVTSVGLMRRIDDYRRLPFYFLHLSYGNQSFQVTLPSPRKDWVMREHTASVPPFPLYSDKLIEEFGPPQSVLLDLTGLEVVRGEIETVTFSYGDVTPIGSSEEP
ncbi:HNH endonuclease, partial [Heyndrickxia sporothermodurans]